MNTVTNMKIIKLDENYKNQYYDFINEQLVIKKLVDNPLWKNIEWAGPKREIYAYFDENNHILMTIASNHTPLTNMPWRYGDSHVSATGRSFYQNIDITKQLIRFMLDDCEQQGVWGQWFVSDSRKNKALSNKSVKTNLVDEKIGKFALPYIEAFENYNLHDVAIIKKGCKSGVPLYDSFVKNNNITDTVLRFASRKYQYFRDSTPTFG